MNLFKALVLQNAYVFYVEIKLHSLSYKDYLLSGKYVNELFYFNIFNPIFNTDIRPNYRILFNFIKNKNKKFYIYFNTYKNKILSVFKFLK